MSRLDMIVGRKDKNGKTHWTKIGSAWPSDKGGYQLVFDALPLTDAEGRCSALLVEPKPRDDDRPASNGARKASSDMDGDEIPF